MQLLWKCRQRGYSWIWISDVHSEEDAQIPSTPTLFQPPPSQSARVQYISLVVHASQLVRNRDKRERKESFQMLELEEVREASNLRRNSILPPATFVVVSAVGKKTSDFW